MECTIEKDKKVCSVEGCNGKQRSRTYCIKHYNRYLKYGNPLTLKQFQEHKHLEKCTIYGCNNKHFGRGYCQKHYFRWDKYGDPYTCKKVGGQFKNIKCSFKSCQNKSKVKGYCAMHYSRLLRHKSLVVIGKGEIKCVNCGCNDERIIEINHKNGGGNREVYKLYGSNLYFYKAIVDGKRSIDDLELTCKVCNQLHYINMKFGKTKHKILWEL